CYQYYSGYRTF
nr:immunoglobulin light chain junction region [Macaca mulatta]